MEPLWQDAHVPSPVAPVSPAGGLGKARTIIGTERIATICATRKVHLRPVLLERASIPNSIVRSPFLKNKFSLTFRKLSINSPGLSQGNTPPFHSSLHSHRWCAD